MNPELARAVGRNLEPCAKADALHAGLVHLKQNRACAAYHPQQLER